MVGGQDKGKRHPILSKQKKIKDAGKGARQVIDKGVNGARHMVDKQALDARQRDFQNKVKIYGGSKRKAKGNESARPRYKKTAHKKWKTKSKTTSKSRHRSQSCKSKMQVKGASQRC